MDSRRSTSVVTRASRLEHLQVPFGHGLALPAIGRAENIAAFGGGRGVISDIVSDRPVPDHMQAAPELWSGCISGALTRKHFLESCVGAGFASVAKLKFDREARRAVKGIRFHATTVEARQEAIEEEGPCGG